MGHEFFKSQIGVRVMKILRVYEVGHYSSQYEMGGGSCIFVGKSGVGHTKLAF